MKRQSLEAILGEMNSGPYLEQYEYIKGLLDAGRIKPVKSSGKNGKKPALYLEYWLIDEQVDYSNLEQELLFEMDLGINIDYYMHNLPVYDKDREAVRQLHDFLYKHKPLLQTKVSYNERSLQIWGFEKFLSQSKGKTILKHCGLDLAFLNCYSTTEPFAYFTFTRKTPQKLLIIENKDTFFSMRRHLLDGHATILGEKIGTLIYGAGKRVISSFQQFALSAEPYMLHENNEFLYFGDLDYEGIGIYENLAACFKEQAAIKPFVAAYALMLTKSKSIAKLPTTKEGQNRQMEGFFFDYFDGATQEDMRKLLEQNLYIPQEILTVLDY